jgi:glyoxylase-like metal-dependent hydrolase (beta-lactamase superfamily II)
MSTWQVFALKFAENSQRRRYQHFMGIEADPHDAIHPLVFYLWAAKRADGHAVVIDTGFSRARGVERGHAMFREPAEALALVGIDAASVQDVVVSHFHWDHAGGWDAFPAARFHIQAREMAYATGPCMCFPHLRRPFACDDVTALVRLTYADRVVFHDGDAAPLPGITLHRIGGHSAGLMAVSVAAEQGTVLLASDAAHFYETIEGRPFPIVHDMPSALAGHAFLRARRDAGDAVVPGHDPAVMRNFPALPGAEGAAVRLG